MEQIRVVELFAGVGGFRLGSVLYRLVGLERYILSSWTVCLRLVGDLYAGYPYALLVLQRVR